MKCKLGEKGNRKIWVLAFIQWKVTVSYNEGSDMIKARCLVDWMLPPNRMDYKKRNAKKN